MYGVIFEPPTRQLVFWDEDATAGGTGELTVAVEADAEAGRGDQTGQEPRSAGHTAAASVIAELCEAG